jgi:hypothetical protein
MKSKKYKVPKKEYSRKQIHRDLVSEIKKMQTKLQLKENMRNGTKASSVTFTYASKKIAERLKRK